MFRIDTPNKAVDLFGTGKHGFRDGDKVNGINATELSAAQQNALQEELAAIIEAAGGTLNKANNAQVLEAIKRLIDAQAGNFALDTGAANAYVVALDPAITAYTDGMTVRVKAVNANTGASTLNAGGGVVALTTDDGGALADGDIAAGSIFTATFVQSATKFYITSIVQSELDARYAKLAGLITQVFSTAALTTAGLFDISGASAGQIKFPSTQNPSADVNTLDDYEEGNWTPILAATGATFNYVSEGRYTKIGRLVMAQGYVDTAANPTGTVTNGAYISGFPFANNAGGYGSPLNFGLREYLTQAAGGLELMSMLPNGATIAQLSFSTNGSLSVPCLASHFVGSDTRLAFSISYNI